MPDRPYADDDDAERPSLFLLILDALGFVVRNRMIFAVVALPIVGLAGGIDWILDSSPLFEGWRNHWGWDFLFGLVYAMFLDSWIKEALLDGAFPCDEVDNLRRSIVATRFLFYAAFMFVLAYTLGSLPIDWIVDSDAIPYAALGPVLAAVLPWLPHIVFWSMVLAFFCMILPSYSAAEPITLHEALRLGRAVRPVLIELVLGTVLIAMLGYAAADWGQHHLPPKPWATAAMTAVHRLIDCLLLAVAGYALAKLYRRLTDWRPPLSAEHPYASVATKPRRVPLP